MNKNHVINQDLKIIKLLIGDFNHNIIFLWLIKNANYLTNLNLLIKIMPPQFLLKNTQYKMVWKVFGPLTLVCQVNWIY